MTVYADVLVIVNLYVDFFLLWCVKKFLALRVRNRRLALGAAAGALCSLTALLPASQAWLPLLMGAAASLLVTAAAFAPVKPRMFLRAAACFWAFSLLLAGFFLFLLQFFAPGHVAVFGNVVYFDLSLPLLFLFTCLAYGVSALLRRLLPERSQSLSCQWLLLENNGVSIRLFAKADTGNSLREPFSGLPVVVCGAKSLHGAAPPEVVSFLEQNSAAPPTDGRPSPLRLVPYESVGGSGVLPAFKPERLTAEKTGEALCCYIAVSGKELSAGQFDALYNPDLFF